MALTTRAYTYVTDADIDEILSANGVTARLDDDASGTISAAEELRRDNAQVLASETLDYYLYSRYAPNRLAESNLVNLWAAYYAAWHVCQARGNPVPKSISDYILDFIEPKLEDISAGRKFLPGVPLRRTQAPTWDNIRANPRYSFKVLRVERKTSSKEPTDLPVVVDYASEYSYEI